MNMLAVVLATLLPVIPQPTEWSPREGYCDLNRVSTKTAIIEDEALGEEGYRMEISPEEVKISAATEIGLIWGRQTLNQLRERGVPAQCGTIFDTPKYRVRGFMLDVGRMYHPMSFLYRVAKYMARYKMNVLHIHLNDNEIVKDPNADWSTKQAAFRLECETYPGLTATDGHYTKKEFRQFMLDCRDMGITVIPEIDVPAHSLAFTRYRPDFASSEYGKDHLDLNKMDEIIPFMDKLFAEYLTGHEPTFIGPYCHVGTDEYNKKEAEKFRLFTDKMLEIVEKYGYLPCAWGALTHAKGVTPVRASKDITMDIWHNPYYQPKEALEAGYSIVSIPDGLVYLVPMAGYYYDFLNVDWLYQTWEPRWVGNYYVPDEQLDQVAGGKFALWNDMLGRGYNIEDNWIRITPAVQVLGQKFWSGNRPDESLKDFLEIKLSMP